MWKKEVTLFCVWCIISCAIAARVPRQAPFVGSSVLDDVPLIDGHNDFPYNLYGIEQNAISTFNFNTDLRLNPKWANRSSSHTDLPRLRQGKVGGQFWVAYVSCSSNYKDAVELTMDQIDVIKRLVAMNPNDMKLVTTADGITAAFNEKKIASMICVEGGHSIDSRMGVLRLYHELGVRYMTLTHNCNLPWVDNNQMDSPTNIATPKLNGLSAWGKSLILEMNRLGIMVDLSHVSKAVMIDALNTSKAPIIFSHSSSYTMHQSTRNVQDDVLKLVKTNGGIVMINFYTEFVAGPNATIMDVVRHLEHIRAEIGADHIGLGADYDGVSAVPVGLEDVSKYPDLFDLLGTRGWSAEELRKLAGSNLIRVFKAVEATRDSLASTLPYDVPIPYEDLLATNETFSCRSDFRPRSSASVMQQSAAVLFLTAAIASVISRM